VLRDALLKRGDDVVVDAHPAERVSSVDGYHAVVLDSAVYADHWLEPARQLAERHAEALAARAWAATTAGTGRSFSKK
jgi:menaquinone-dependent protoporphyrinogen IX oxidase